MKKKIVFLSALFCVTVWMLAGCGKASPNENSIKQDLPEDFRTICISYDDIEENILLDVDDVEIAKRKTNQSDDVIYCTITMSNENYRCTRDAVLFYSCYNNGEWLLDSWELDGENQSIVPLSGVPKEKAETELSRYYFDSFELIEEEPLKSGALGSAPGGEDEGTYWETTYTYDVSFDSSRFFYDGEIFMYYHFTSIDGCSGQWISTVGYLDCLQLDLMGDWMSDLENADWADGSFEMEIEDIDPANSMISLSAREYWNDFNGVSEYHTDGTVSAYYSVDFQSGDCMFGENASSEEGSSRYDLPRVYFIFQMDGLNDECSAAVTFHPSGSAYVSLNNDEGAHGELDQVYRVE